MKRERGECLAAWVSDDSWSFHSYAALDETCTAGLNVDKTPWIIQRKDTENLSTEAGASEVVNIGQGIIQLVQC